MTELYKKHRPTSYKDVLGQPEAVATLTKLGKAGEIPHALLFTGPSGCGKTTLARITRHKLKCADCDFVEVNSADFRGIDTVRDIRRRMMMAPMAGPCRVWIIDEVHQLTGAAQDAFLKLLEDTPDHVYFMLATTDPQKLKKTIITRCTEIKVKALNQFEMRGLVYGVLEKEGVELPNAVSEKIAEVSDGSARKALVLLNQVMFIEDEQQQLAIIESSDTKKQAIEIARKLMNPKTKWPEMAEVLRGVDEEPESLRWMILGYANSVLLKSGNARASRIIEEFRDNFYDCKKAGLTNACFAMIMGE